MIGGERGYHRHATVMTSRAASAETETLRVAMNRARGSSSRSFCAHCGDPCLVLARAHATTKHHGNVPCLVHPSMHVCDRRQKVTGRFQQCLHHATPYSAQDRPTRTAGSTAP